MFSVCTYIEVDHTTSYISVKCAMPIQHLKCCFSELSYLSVHLTFSGKILCISRSGALDILPAQFCRFTHNLQTHANNRHHFLTVASDLIIYNAHFIDAKYPIWLMQYHQITNQSSSYSEAKGYLFLRTNNTC
jgi:hypothetical protein